MQKDIQTTVTAFLTVKDAQKAFAFYTEAFGAKVANLGATGEAARTGKLSIGESVFWVGEEEPMYGNISPSKEGKSSVRMILTVADPDTVFSNALRAGAKQICPVTTEAFWKIGKLADPFGHIWEIGRPLE